MMMYIAILTILCAVGWYMPEIGEALRRTRVGHSILTPAWNRLVALMIAIGDRIMRRFNL